MISHKITTQTIIYLQSLVDIESVNMVFINYRVTVSAVAFLLVIQLAVIDCFHSAILDKVADTVNSILTNGVLPALQNDATRTLNSLKTVGFEKKTKKSEILSI